MSYLCEAWGGGGGIDEKSNYFSDKKKRQLESCSWFIMYTSNKMSCIV